ncbi:hypothetical protein LINGRAHAP2_LOCUS36268 [Linum grandiflorum]
MRPKNGTSSSAATPADKEQRKENFLQKVISGEEATKLASFYKRLPTLRKKAMELSTLCGVTVLVVAAGRDGKVRPLWPDRPENVKKAIESYRTAEKKIETTVLGYLDEGEKKKVKSKFRALKKRLANWVDWLEGDDEGLKNAVAFCASKIEELERRIRVSGSGGAEDDGKGKKKVVESSMADCEELKEKDDGDEEVVEEIEGLVGGGAEDRKQKRVVTVDEEIEGFGGGGAQAQDRKRKKVATSSSMANVEIIKVEDDFDDDEEIEGFAGGDGGILLDWFSDNNGSFNTQFPSNEQSIGNRVGGDFNFPPPQPAPLASIPENCGGGWYFTFPLTEQVGNRVGVSQPDPLAYVPDYNGGYNQFPLPEQSIIKEEVGGISHPAPLNWVPAINGRYNSQFPPMGPIGNEFGINPNNNQFHNYGNGALMGDPQSSLLHGYGNEFGASGSSDLYGRIPIGNEALFNHTLKVFGQFRFYPV